MLVKVKISLDNESTRKLKIIKKNWDKNLKKQLKISYPDRHYVNFSKSDNQFIATLTIPHSNG